MIDPLGRVLVQRRPPGAAHAGLWEFPGGKVERDESAEDALIRELFEELGITLRAADLVPLTFSTGGGLLLLLYTVRRWSGTPRPLHATALDWRHPVDLDPSTMPALDRPLIAALVKR